MRAGAAALTLCTAFLAGLAGCAQEERAEEPADQQAEEVQEVVLGPVDGHDLPATDLERVSAGDLAPDFTAMSRDGEAITLSGYRGQKNVVLVFYRGHW
jgi:hypothetical protein